VVEESSLEKEREVVIEEKFEVTWKKIVRENVLRIKIGWRLRCTTC
jgi:hypothetical protein